MQNTILTFVGYYLPGYKGGGPVRTVANLVQALHRKYRFKLVCYDRDLGDAAPYRGVVRNRWLTKKSDTRLYLPGARYRWKAVKRVSAEADLYYMQQLYNANVLFPLLLQRWLGLIPDAPIVVVLHGILQPEMLKIKWLKKKIYLSVLQLLGVPGKIWWQVLTEDERKQLGVHLGKAAVERSFLIPNIIAFPPMRKRTAQKKQGAVRFVFISRIAKQKNLTGALQAMRMVKGDVVFDIYGPKEDAAYWQECQEIIASLPANIKVTHKGSVPNQKVAATLAKYDFYMLTSLAEGFSMSLMEALAAGLPVVGSDRLQFDLTENKGGWSVKLDDTRGFTRVMQECVNMKNAEYVSRSKDARALAERYANDPSLLKKYEAMFESVIARHAKEKSK